MQSTSGLVEKHIRESEARLRHIDELMTRSSHRGHISSNSVQDLLSHTRESREKLAAELEGLRRESAIGVDQAMVRRSERLTSLLEAIGRQFEKALAGVFDCRGL